LIDELEAATSRKPVVYDYSDTQRLETDLIGQSLKEGAHLGTT